MLFLIMLTISALTAIAGIIADSADLLLTSALSCTVALLIWFAHRPGRA